MPIRTRTFTVTLMMRNEKTEVPVPAEVDPLSFLGYSRQLIEYVIGRIETSPRTSGSAKKPQNSELPPFLAFWDELDALTQSEFEQQALAQDDPIKRRWYDDARTCGRDTADYFRLAVLNDHFRRIPVW